MTAHAQRRRERTSAAAARSVRLRVDTLALHGVASAEAARLAYALETELAGLAAQADGRLASAAVERLPAARFSAGRVPEQTAGAVASAVWSRISAAGAAIGE
jgi:hypothetical protein